MGGRYHPVNIDHPKVIPEPNSGCWIWLGTETSGYGRLKRKKTSPGMTRTIQAHRASYEFAKGPIPAGLTVDHLCRNKLCVNPEHLEAVTNAENVRRADPGAAGRDKTHCPNGHAYEGNTYFAKCGRLCRTCMLKRSAIYYRKRRAAGGYSK